MFNGNICAHKLILRGRREHVLLGVYISYFYMIDYAPYGNRALLRKGVYGFFSLCTNAAAATMPVRALTVYFIVTGVADFRDESAYTHTCICNPSGSEFSTSFSQNKSAQAESEFK